MNHIRHFVAGVDDFDFYILDADITRASLRDGAEFKRCFGLALTRFVRDTFNQQEIRKAQTEGLELEPAKDYITSPVFIRELILMGIKNLKIVHLTAMDTDEWASEDNLIDDDLLPPIIE